MKGPQVQSGASEINWSLKAALLLARCTNPCPPPSFRRTRMIYGTQCFRPHLLQKKWSLLLWRKFLARATSTVLASASPSSTHGPSFFLMGLIPQVNAQVFKTAGFPTWAYSSVPSPTNKSSIFPQVHVWRRNKTKLNCNFFFLNT